MTTNKWLSRRLLHGDMMLKTALICLASAALSSAASLTQVTAGWDNPTKLSFFIYVPDKLAEKPAVVTVVRIADTCLWQSNS